MRFEALIRQLAENALRARLAARWNQEEVAHRSGLTIRAYASIERGQTRNPTLASIHAIAEALGLEIAALLGAPRGRRPAGLPRGRYAFQGVRQR